MPESDRDLASQRSSYLLSHAKDPVAWHTFSPRAFDIAREQGLPVFLSIGYDSCHWCHVMQRESFRDLPTAELLNERFVAVKVDRELRPDVDHLYMTYVTLASGHGGWPMSVFTTPDKAPFFGGTYFPKQAPAGKGAFGDVLRGVSDAFAGDREQVDGVGAEALEMVQRAMRPVPLRPIDPDLVDGAARAVIEMSDATYGGLGGAPKFPQAPLLRFLIGYAESTGDQEALDVSRRWLRAMVRGGTYDQVGGGLFRYSTDERWLVPHFEKMLYDNGLLLSAIGAMYRIEPSEELAAVARQTAEFLERDLGAGDGAYYSSLDAEAGGVEGEPYAWSWAQLTEVCDAGQLEVARGALGATEQGNWHRTNILTRAEGRGDGAETADAVLSALLEARSARPQPKVITNLLTEWNALVARGLMEAGDAIGDDKMVHQGLATLTWLRDRAVDGERVVHAIDDPSVSDVTLIADYAALAAACATAARIAPDDAGWQQLALTLLDGALARFDEGAVLFMSGADTDLPVRPISYDDAPTPSGAATLVEVLQMLRPNDAEAIARLLIPATGIVERAPYMAGTWLQVMATKVERER